MVSVHVVLTPSGPIVLEGPAPHEAAQAGHDVRVVPFDVWARVMAAAELYEQAVAELVACPLMPKPLILTANGGVLA